MIRRLICKLLGHHWWGEWEMFSTFDLFPTFVYTGTRESRFCKICRERESRELKR